MREGHTVHFLLKGKNSSGMVYEYAFSTPSGMTDFVCFASDMILFPTLIYMMFEVFVHWKILVFSILFLDFNCPFFLS